MLTASLSGALRLGPVHFYETGRHLLSLPLEDKHADDDNGEELGLLLVEMLTKRFKEIYSKSTNADDSEQYQEKLDSLEKTLYSAGQQSLRTTADWMARKTDKITAGKAVTMHLLRKRKATDMS